MKTDKFTYRAAVYLLPIKDGQILLSRRFNTGYEDGKYSLIAGHMDGSETVKQAMIREAGEEAGITVSEVDLEVVHTMHRLEAIEYIDFYLVATQWKGEPRICEPDKCDELRWCNLDELPENTLAYVQQAIECYRGGVSFSQFIKR